MTPHTAEHVRALCRVNIALEFTLSPSSLTKATAIDTIAEGSGLFSSVIQVTGAGPQVSKILFECVEGAVAGDCRNRDTAIEIEPTSIVTEDMYSITIGRHPWFPRKQ